MNPLACLFYYTSTLDPTHKLNGYNFVHKATTVVLINFHSTFTKEMENVRMEPAANVIELVLPRDPLKLDLYNVYWKNLLIDWI